MRKSRRSRRRRSSHQETRLINETLLLPLSVQYLVAFGYSCFCPFLLQMTIRSRADERNLSSRRKRRCATINSQCCELVFCTRLKQKCDVVCFGLAFLQCYPVPKKKRKREPVPMPACLFLEKNNDSMR